MKCSRLLFKLLDAGSQPTGERWVGKNWACSHVIEQVASEWVLFVDADVRLQPATLWRTLVQAAAACDDPAPMPAGPWRHSPATGGGIQAAGARDSP